MALDKVNVYKNRYMDVLPCMFGASFQTSMLEFFVILNFLFGN